MPLETRTPFVIVSTLDSPRTIRLRDVDRDAVAAAVESLVDDPGAVVSVRLEGVFTSVLVRSVPPQDPPYRTYAEVCDSD
jgi:alpha-acetolactate decarboxylase